MKTPAFGSFLIPKPARASLLIVLMSATALHAQQVRNGTPIPDDEVSREDVVELSPFVVSEADEQGYRATSTLAGSRLKTPLKDLAGAIQVVTEDFLKDTGSTDASRLLLYTTSTEVAGADGNFTGANGGTEDGGVRHNTGSVNRVRGLASADSTRSYFLTDIHFDSYNTDRVTISRGPNGMLFGLGSPGGVIDNSLKQAKFKDINAVEFSVDSLGSTRAVLDINRVIVPDKVALRVIGLKKEDKYQQEESFKQEQRLYGALTFKPFENTVFRVNGELGSVHSSKPSQIAPKSAIADWVDNGMLLATANLDPKFRLSSMPDRRGPVYIFDQADSDVPSLGFHLGTRTPQAATPLTSLRTWGSRENTLEGDSKFHRNAAMTDADRWIFDYRKHSIMGNLNRQYADFDALNLVLEQTFLDNRAGIEVAYDVQKNTSSWNDRVNNDLYVDVSPLLPYTVYNPVTKTNDPVPNPNVGRPFVSMDSGYSETVTDRSAWRITGFYDLDFKRETSRFGWLGRHVFTGMLSNQSFQTRRASTQYGDAMGGETDVIVDGNTAGANFKASSWDRSVIGVRYLGDITGVGSSTITPPLSNAAKPQQYTAVMWNRLATPNLPGEVGAWQTRTISILDNPITGASLNKDSVDSFALISQSYLLNNNLVLTAGWRQDDSEKWFTNQPERTADDIVILDSLALPATPNDQVTGEAFSWGAVAHLPDSWQRKLGFGFSVHYGISENFEPLAGRVDVLNRPLDNPQGDTTEMGFSVSLLDSRLQLRFNKYETSSKNQTDGSLGGGSIPNYERLFYNNVRTLFTGPGQANENWATTYILPPQGMMDAYWTPKNPNPAPGGTTSVADAGNPNVTGTSDFTSEGLEFDGTFNATKNWSITFNAAQQEARKTNVLQTYQDYLDIRNPEYARMANLVVRPNGLTLGDAVRTNAQRVIAAERSRNNSILPEIREWRFNLVNRYAFTDGRLKGWAVGGAVRWQDKAAIGYHTMINEFGTRVIDIDAPIYGPTQLTTDLFVNYSRKIMRDRVKWKLQLNVFNLLDDDDDIPVAADDDLVVVANRIQTGLTLRLSNSFEF